jgi:hypothetical protein
MKKYWILTLFVLTLSSKCKEEMPIAEGYINLTFKPTIDAKPLIINKIYELNGKRVRFTKLQFYLTDFNINSKDISSGKDEVLLVNLTSLDDSLNSVQGLKLPLKNLAEDADFTINNMSIGIKSAYNSKKPKDFSSSNPLSDGTDYWDDWNSYIFFKLEGLIDKDNDGRLESGITLHTGGDEALRNISFPKNFTIDNKGTTNLHFEVNMNTILRGIDLQIVNSSHQVSEKPIMLKLMDNLKASITLK